MVAFFGFNLLLLLVVFAVIACFKLPKTVAVAVAASLWLLYGVYEYLVQTRVLCSGECNIRVDLLLIYPVLLSVTLAAGRGLVKSRRESQALHQRSDV